LSIVSIVCCGALFFWSGTEHVLYSFKGDADGAIPVGNLIYFNNALYGTTLMGGGIRCSNGSGCGTILKITK
jgi:hypothetical protein